MKGLLPIAVTDDTLLYSSSDEPTTEELAEIIATGTDSDYIDWDVAFSYSEGNWVIYNHTIYESMVAGASSNTGNTPGDGSEWEYVKPTNRWAMFDQYVSTKTTADTQLQVMIELDDADFVDSIALLGLSGVVSVKVEVIDMDSGSSSLSGSPSASPSASVSGSPSASVSGSPSASPSASVSGSPSASPSPSSSLSGSPSESLSGSLSGSLSSSPSPSSSLSGSPSVSPSTSLSGSPSSSPSPSDEIPIEFGTEAISFGPEPIYFGDPPLGATFTGTPVRPLSIPLTGLPNSPFWSETFDIGIFETDEAGWYDYFFSKLTTPGQWVFTDIGTYKNAALRVTLYGGTGMEVGALVFGRSRDLGCTLFGANLGITDYSTKEFDEFGRATIIERVYANTLECDLYFAHTQLRTIYKFLSDVRATPVVWIGSEEDEFDATIIYGFYKDFNIELRDASGCYCSLQIEGLT